MATHSPLLMAYPCAACASDACGLRPIAVEDRAFRMMRSFWSIDAFEGRLAEAEDERRRTTTTRMPIPNMRERLATSPHCIETCNASKS